MESPTSLEAFTFLARLEILPEWEAAARVRFVKLGKLRLNLEGQELPHV